MNKEIRRKEVCPGKVLMLVQGDLTEEPVDAIVNAANSHLQHGGGVAAAIVRRGGRIIQEESDRIGFVSVGNAALTSAGNLPAKYVIHAVGPRWGEGDEEQKLRNAVWSSLELASHQNLTSISLPAISSGIFGFPKKPCAQIILKAINEYLHTYPQCSLGEVRVCLYDRETVQIFSEVFEENS